MSHPSRNLQNDLIRQSFTPYLVPTPPLSISLSTHPLFPQHCFTCHLNSKSCIGYYQLIDSHNYFPILQELFLLKSMNERGVFVEFMGVWLESQEDETILLHIIFEKLETSIKELLFSPTFNQQLFWQYLSAVSRGMLFLDQKKLSHGNLNLYSLLSKSSSPKLFYFASRVTSLDIWNASQQDRDFLFLSPEELVAYKSNSYHIGIMKSDVFNLGTILITILQSGLATESFEDHCERRLEEIQKRYGFNVYYILERMTRTEAEQRIQWYEIEPYVNQLSSKGKESFKDKNISALDFRQGSFNKITHNQKELVGGWDDHTQNSRNERVENRKRRSIFGNKRNLLSNESETGNEPPTTAPPNEQCLVAECYLKY